MAKESPDDESLLERVGEGDGAAFAVLVRRHRDRYYRLAYRYTARHEEAEDIVQVAFIKLWETPDIWNPRRGARFTTWFYRVVVNLCLDSRKNAARRRSPNLLNRKTKTLTRKVRLPRVRRGPCLQGRLRGCLRDRKQL